MRRFDLKKLTKLWLLMSLSWPIGYFISAFIRSVMHHVAIVDALYVAADSFIANGIPVFCVFTLIYVGAAWWLSRSNDS